MADKIRQYWPIILTVALVAGWLWDYWGVRADASDAKTAMQQQVEINQKLSALVIESNSKLGVYLEIMGFDKEKARTWAAMPRNPVTDSAGTPITGVPWLETDSTLMVGLRLMFADSGLVLVDTLWDLREKK